MSCGSCTGRGGTSGNSARLSLFGGRRTAVYWKPTGATGMEGQTRACRQGKTTKQPSAIINQLPPKMLQSRFRLALRDFEEISNCNYCTDIVIAVELVTLNDRFYIILFFIDKHIRNDYGVIFAGIPSKMFSEVCRM